MKAIYRVTGPHGEYMNSFDSYSKAVEEMERINSNSNYNIKVHIESIYE